jgi:hypothetical protein
MAGSPSVIKARCTTGPSSVCDCGVGGVGAGGATTAALPEGIAAADPDETFALGSKDPDVRSLLVEAVDQQISAVFDQIDPRTVTVVLIGVFI